MVEIKEIKLMEMVVVLWLSNVISNEEREKFLKLLQDRLNRKIKEQEGK